MDWADEAAKNFDGYTAGRVELLKDIAAALRAAELRGRVAGMREVADLINAHRNAAPKFYWEDGEKALFNKIDRLVRTAASKLSPTQEE